MSGEREIRHVVYKLTPDGWSTDTCRSREWNLTETPNGILQESAGGGTKVLIPWHRIWEVWYK